MHPIATTTFVSGQQVAATGGSTSVFKLQKKIIFLISHEFLILFF
jgi:hypothetical protein